MTKFKFMLFQAKCFTQLEKEGNESHYTVYLFKPIHFSHPLGVTS